MKFKQMGKEYEGRFELAEYANNRNTCIRILSKDNEMGGCFVPHGNLSINTDETLPLDEFVAKNYSGYEGVPEQFIAMGYFADTGKRVTCDYVENVPILKMLPKFLEETDKHPK